MLAVRDCHTLPSGIYYTDGKGLQLKCSVGDCVLYA